MYGPGPYVNRVWKACCMLIGFFPAGCTSIRIAATVGYEYHLFLTVTQQLNGLILLNKIAIILL
jgi:hypothetical protein